MRRFHYEAERFTLWQVVWSWWRVRLSVRVYHHPDFAGEFDRWEVMPEFTYERKVKP